MWLDFLIVAAIVLGVVLAIRYKKKHKGCCGNCSQCSSCTHKENDTKQ